MTTNEQKHAHLAAGARGGIYSLTGGVKRKSYSSIFTFKVMSIFTTVIECVVKISDNMKLIMSPSRVLFSRRKVCDTTTVTTPQGQLIDKTFFDFKNVRDGQYALNGGIAEIIVA